MCVDVLSLPMAWQPSLTFLPKETVNPKIVSFPDPIIEQLNAENTVWERCKELFSQRSAFRQSVESLAANTEGTQDYEKILPILVEAFHSSDYHVLRRPLRQILTTLTLEQFGKLFNQLIDKGIDEKGLESLHKCLSLIPQAHLETILGQAIMASNKTPKETLEGFALAEKEYRKLITSSDSTNSKETRPPFVKMVHNFIDTCLAAFRISDIGKEATSTWEANERLSSYIQLTGFVGVVFTAISAICLPVVAFIVTGAICAAASLGAWAYLKWGQLSPDNIEYCQNLTAQAMKGTFSPVLGRESEIDEIINCLAASTDGHRAHPLLCGPSGVGKTEIVRGIAQRIAMGDVPECLQGKKLLFINTAELISNYGASSAADKLQYILNKMGQKKKDYIVFLDEVHNVMKGTADTGDRLKTILDTNPEGLPYCIAATTQEEYKKFVEPDLAFTRRFQKINIEPTDKKQTILIMREMINREAPDIGVSEAILENIFDETTRAMPKLHQPASSKRILSKAISSIRIRTELVTSPAILKKQKKLANLSSALHAAPDAATAGIMLDKMQKLRHDIERLKEKQEAEIKAGLEIHQLKHFRAQEITSMFKMALKASEDPSANVEALHFVFWNYYLVPYLTSKVDAYGDAASTQIDSQLISELIAKEAAPAGV